MIRLEDSRALLEAWRPLLETLGCCVNLDLPLATGIFGVRPKLGKAVREAVAKELQLEIKSDSHVPVFVFSFSLVWLSGAPKKKNVTFTFLPPISHEP